MSGWDEEREIERRQEEWAYYQQLAEWEGDIEYASWFSPPPGSAA